ncbi:MAG TPA: Gldg family protein, partial [Flavisolibacter sp.]|nr:Gldg family protein [Flavisolibacter sp.]
NLYLYLPLLTMGLMSRETSSGSIKLLLSSPVTIKEIILGKYLAMVYYGLLFIMVLVMYAAIAVAYIPQADYGLILSGLIGVFILICTYSAIGLFMSSLTSYQIIAAISTIAVFAALQFIGSVGQDLDLVRDITYFLSLSGRANKFIAGLVTSKDLAYFIIIIAVFLSLTILRLEANRRSAPRLATAGRYFLLICAALLLGYLTSRPRLIQYADMTATKRHSLTESSLQWLKRLDGPVTITTYVNLFDQDFWIASPANRNYDLQQLQTFERFIPDLTIKYIYFYDTTSADAIARSIVARATEEKKKQTISSSSVPLDGVAQVNAPVYKQPGKIIDVDAAAVKVADNMDLDIKDFLKPSDIKKLVNLVPENNRIVREIAYNGRKTYLRFYTGMNKYPGEEEIVAAIRRLIEPPPLAVFLTGNGERSTTLKGDRTYLILSEDRSFRNALINQGFDIVNVNPRLDSIPASASVVVVADPLTPLDSVALQKLRSYKERGGNLLIAGEPGRTEIINPLLSMIGVQLNSGVIVRATTETSPDWIVGELTPEARLLDSTLFSRMEDNKVIMPGVTGLQVQPSGYTVTPLLISPKGSWSKNERFDPSAVNVSFDPMAGDREGSIPVMAALQRKQGGKDQRIIVAGDADFMSNAVLKTNGDENFPLLISLFRWFTGGEFPVTVQRIPSKDNTLTLKKREIFPLRVAFLGVFPALLLAGGALFLVRRGRK